VADHHDAIGVAAMLPDVALDPGKRRRDVLDVSGM